MAMALKMMTLDKSTMHYKQTINYKYLNLIAYSVLTWWHSIVVRTSVLAGDISLSCARLMDGRLTTLWIKLPLSVNQQGQLSLPSLCGRLIE